MAAENPFVPVKIKCPFCSTESVQRYIKSRMYQPDIVEEDSHVAAYKWENPEFARIRPNFYHIWHCPQCHLCDEKEVFRGEDSSGGKLEMIQEKLLAHSRLPSSMIPRLGKAIDFSQDEYGVDSAILAHLLAIYEQELLSVNMRQYAKLARFYLRTAWLFREREMLALPGTLAPEYGSLDDFLETFRNDWPGIPCSEKPALETALARYEDVLNHSSGLDFKYEVSIMNLIIAMLRRSGRPADALRMVRGVFTAAVKARQTARAAINKNINTEKNQGVLNFAALTVEKASALAEELGDIVFREELPAAKEAVLKIGPVTDGRMLTEKLRELKFSDITCRRMGKIFDKQVQK